MKLNMATMVIPASMTFWCFRKEWKGLKAIWVPEVRETPRRPNGWAGLDSVCNSVVWVKQPGGYPK